MISSKTNFESPALPSTAATTPFTAPPTTASLPARQPLNLTQRVIKRAFDIVFSLGVLLMTLPLFVLIGIAIKLDSAGPILFRQVRYGQFGHRFTIYKFRSMVLDADELVPHDQAGFYVKRPDDPRVTRVGRFLRRTSLDELPQFINVLLGDMSVVGPRPEVLWIAAQYAPWQWERVVVPQGITGWWQITGRATTPLQNNIMADLYYVRHYSLWLDLKILLLTIPCVLSGKGAF